MVTEYVAAKKNKGCTLLIIEAPVSCSLWVAGCILSAANQSLLRRIVIRNAWCRRGFSSIGILFVTTSTKVLTSPAIWQASRLSKVHIREPSFKEAVQEFTEHSVTDRWHLCHKATN